MTPRSIDWSISQDRCELERFTLTEASAVNSDYGQVVFERIEISAGIVANIVEIDSRRSFELAAGLQEQGDRVCLQTTLSGQCGVDIEDGIATGYREGVSVAHAVRGTSATFRFPEGQRLRTMSFTFSHEAFADWFYGDVPEALRILVREPADPGASARLRISGSTQALADAAFSERLSGALRRLQIDGLSRAFVARFATGLSGEKAEPNGPDVGRVLRDRLYDIRARILSDPDDLPTLDALAREAGVDHKRLNAGFRELFGATVFEFCRNHRLDRARLDLLEGNALVKEAAYGAGYVHVSNFVTAYRRRFGTPPGADRKRHGVRGA